MATRFELVLCGDDPVFLRAAGEEALDEVARLEAQLSLYRPDSELSGINARAAAEAVPVEPRFFALLERIAALSAATDGAFDPTVAPLMRLWGLGGGLRAENAARRVPEAESLEAAREQVGMRHVVLERETRTVRFARPGMCLDLGAVGKGYAVERAAAILREAGVAAALLHAGTSTVAAVGAPPGEEAWSVAIRHPVEADRHLAHVRLRDRALSVSAPHGKSFTRDGFRYGHVLDPRTGCPVQGALLAAVVSDSATESDALSTALLALGAEGAARLRRHDPGCWGVVVPGAESAGTGGDGLPAVIVGDPEAEVAFPEGRQWFGQTSRQIENAKTRKGENAKKSRSSGC
jgi:thiamine biosynthesis lipoprotein